MSEPLDRSLLVGAEPLYLIEETGFGRGQRVEAAAPGHLPPQECALSPAEDSPGLNLLHEGLVITMGIHLPTESAD